MRKETRNILVTCTESKNPDSLQGVTIEDRKKGMFSIGCHYLITRNGDIFKGRQESDVGNFLPAYNANSIIIRLVGLGWDFTEEQHASLFELEDELQERYPDAEVLEFLPIPNKSNKQKK